MCIKTTQKGSVLAFALIIMSMILVSGVAILGASVAMERASLSGSKSPQAYFNAESYAELTLQKFRIGDTTGSASPKFNTVLTSIDYGSCSDGIWHPQADVDVTITKTDGSGNKITPRASCGDSLPGPNSVIYIKVLAKNQGVQRAVEVKYTF